MKVTPFYEEITGHFKKYIDNYDDCIIMHEKESSDFHLDVYQMQPSKTRDYILLVTSGVSAIPLNVPKGAPFSQYIELCILLPSNWKLEYEDMKQEENYWPVRLLKDLGRYPSHYNTWFGFGHTVEVGTIIGTEFMSATLVKAKSLPDEFQSIRCGDNRIEIYTIVPLYKEELNYAEQNRTEDLLTLFDKNDISDIVDLKRKNVCKNTSNNFGNNTNRSFL